MPQEARGPAIFAREARDATDRKDWVRALELWDSCIELHPKNPGAPGWRQSRAVVLATVGRFDEAEAECNALMLEFPESPSGYAGFARLAQLQRNWAQAILRWRECLVRFSNNPSAHGWSCTLGIALIEAGQYAEAQELYARLAEKSPHDPTAFLGLARAATRRRHWAEALAFWDDLIGRFKHKVEPNWTAERAKVLIELGRLAEAEQTLQAMADCSTTRTQGLIGMAQIAMRRGWWLEALVWWDMLWEHAGGRAEFPWVLQRASVLVELGHLDEALKILNELEPPAAMKSPVTIRLATIMVKMERWADALSLLDSLQAQFIDAAQEQNATALRAKALMNLGRVTESEALVRTLVREDPGKLPGLLEILSKTGRPAESMAQLDALAASAALSPQLFAIRLGNLISMRRIPEAQSALIQVMENPEDPLLLTIGLDFAARLFEGPRLTDLWRTMLAALDRMGERRNSAPHPSITALRLRLLFALREHAEYLQLFDQVKDTRLLGRHEMNLCAAASALRKNPFPDFNMPKIFGIGLSKTGTTSLAIALTELNFSTVDFANRITGEMIADEDYCLFDAFTDTPTCIDFEKNFHRFPQSKFIYTVRDPKDWEKSWTSHLKRLFLVSNFEEARQTLRNKDSVHWGQRFVDVHAALYFDHRSYAESFEKYDRRVRDFFSDKPKDRFLELNLFAGDGWAKLCNFLECKPPPVAFPWRNRSPDSTAANTG